MSRRAARIKHDELTRMMKAVLDLGLPIGRVVFDGSELAVVIGGDSGEKFGPANGHAKDKEPQILEPKL